MRRTAIVLAFALTSLFVAATANAGFTNTRLIPPPTDQKIGDSEPAISIDANSTMVIDGLAWLPFQINVWKGQFASTPDYFGALDTDLTKPGAVVLGSGDGDIDLGSTGTIHEAGLDFIVNPTFTSFQLGVSANTCPGALFVNCRSQLIDTTGADRQWVTSNGRKVWISYHDSGSSTLIHVQRSTDDGFTWKSVGSPIPGQGAATGDATFNNIQGPIVADPYTGNLYDIYAAGEASIQKGTTANFNNIYVSRSFDDGKTWQAVLVHHEPLNTVLNNIFPSLAVDPTNGFLYAVWSDQHAVWLSSSMDQGATWSPETKVSKQNTVVMPWVAAYNGTIDVVYYGTSGSSPDDASAVWNTYMSKGRLAGTFKELKASNTPNHHGVVCLQGSGCSANRQLLDLFEIAIDPASSKAAIIYTDDTFDTYTNSSGVHKLPQVVLAQEN